MNAKITLFLTALLIFICCIGAASAADDINDTLTTDNDIVNVEQASDDVDLEDDSSEDTILGVNNDEDVLEANDPTVNNWAELASNAGASGSAKTIYLASGKTFTPTSQIVFGNSATIIGTPTSYISGSYSGIPFKNTNTALSITFKNVNFKDISCTMLMQMLTTGSAKTTLEGCTFTNVNASSSGHNSVIYNNQGTMDITDSTFSNFRAAFGVITNHQHIENGTDGTPYLAIEGCTFENHTGTSDTVYVNGYINAFNDNTFINSPQSSLSGSGNVYNSITVPNNILSKQELLGAVNEDILGDTMPHDTIYVNSSSTNNGLTGRNNGKVDGQSWEQAYGQTNGFYWAFQNIKYGGTIIIADGEYIFDTTYPDWRSRLMTIDCTIIGYEDNVKFIMPDGYNLDFGSEEKYNTTKVTIGNMVYNPDTDETNDVPVHLYNLTIVHKNIIFDCDVKVGSKNFAFVNCTFNKGFEITRDSPSADVCTVSFENCTFANQFNTESIPDNVTVTVNGTQIYPKITDDSGSSSGNDTVNGTNTTKNNDKTDSNTNKQTTTTATTKKVTKKATKITAKKATFKKSKKVKKYSIVLKSGKTLVKKVKVTLKVGKKTYKATTNSKGKATFKINKLTKKGKYTAVIKFKGNKSFKATSKKVKITVKK